MSKPKQAPQTKRTIINDLKVKGFIQIKDFKHLYINKIGNVFSLQTNELLKPTINNYIRPSKDSYLNIAKLLLQAFANKPYKQGQITHIDGNKKNLELSNIKYSSIFEPSYKPQVNKSDLLNAIRCYFEIEKEYNINNSILTRLYLQMIARERDYLYTISKEPYFYVFETYLTNVNNNATDTAKRHKLSIRDTIVIINSFINMLSNEVLKDLNKGTLKILDYQTKISEKKKLKIAIEKYNAQKILNNETPLMLKKKSKKQMLKEFREYTDQLLNTF